MIEIIEMVFGGCRMSKAGKIIAYIVAVIIGVFCGVWAYHLIGTTWLGMRYTVICGICDMFCSAFATAITLFVIRCIKTK